jgi:FkbM family methyltransferase
MNRPNISTRLKAAMHAWRKPGSDNERPIRHATDAVGAIPAPERYPDDTSQHGETSVVIDLVRPDDPHFVVDVGANNGVFLSNSRALILREWNGLLIEPFSSAFVELESLYAESPNVTCVRIACSDQPGTAKLFVGSDEPGQMSTLSSDPVLQLSVRSDHEQVEVETLTNVLREHDAPRDISLLSVDAEGLDYEVLSGLDFDQFQPRMILTEEYPQSPEKHMQKHFMLNEKGYTLYGQYGCNTLWILPQYLPRKA